MDKKEIKKQFHSFYWAQKQVEIDLHRLELMRQRAVSPGALDYSKQIIHGGIPQTLADTAVCLDGFEKQLERDIAKRDAIATRVMNTIDAVDDTRLQVLLTLRYREFKSWAEIAEEMKYSWRQIHNLHSQALDAASKVCA